MSQSHFNLKACCALGAALLALPAVMAADAPAQAPAAPAAVATAASPVYNAVKDMKFVTSARPAANAKYYIILQSASWCGPCRHELPLIVKAYPQMKAAGVELVQLSHDQNIEAAEKWAKEENVPFAIVAPGSNPTFPKALPPAPGIPQMYVLNAGGDVIAEGHPAMILPRWKEICK